MGNGERGTGNGGVRSVAHLRQLRQDLGDWPERRGEALEVARVRAAGVDLRDEAFQVADAREQGAERRERGAVVDEGLHRVEPRVDVGRARERPRNPVAQRPGPHRRLRDVEHAEERRLLRDRLARQELQVAQRARVEHEPVARLAQLDFPHVSERVTQRRADIVEQSPGGGHEVGAPGEPEAVEREHLEVPRQALRRRVGRERPAVLVRRPQDFRRGIALEGLVEGRLRGARLDGELARREVEQREGEAGDGRDVVAARLVEKPVLRHRAGRDDARDLAAHQPLGRLRVLDLVAERGGLAGADELGEVGVDRVVRHTAHRLAVALRQRRAEDRRGDDRVLPEHLVEVAEAEHDDRPRRHLALDREILPHHRCQLGRHVPFPSAFRTSACATGT